MDIEKFKSLKFIQNHTLSIKLSNEKRTLLHYRLTTRAATLPVYTDTGGAVPSEANLLLGPQLSFWASHGIKGGNAILRYIKMRYHSAKMRHSKCYVRWLGSELSRDQLGCGDCVMQQNGPIHIEWLRLHMMLGLKLLKNILFGGPCTPSTSPYPSLPQESRHSSRRREHSKQRAKC